MIHLPLFAALLLFLVCDTDAQSESASQVLSILESALGSLSSTLAASTSATSRATSSLATSQRVASSSAASSPVSSSTSFSSTGVATTAANAASPSTSSFSSSTATSTGAGLGSSHSKTLTVNDRAGIIVGCVLAGVAIVGILIGICCFYSVKKQVRRQVQQEKRESGGALLGEKNITQRSSGAWAGDQQRDSMPPGAFGLPPGTISHQAARPPSDAVPAPYLANTVQHPPTYPAPSDLIAPQHSRYDWEHTVTSPSTTTTTTTTITTTAPQQRTIGGSLGSAPWT
ncbi:hypothetical protein LTR78_003007 [Recurvomyces mirabilis]|uniref:Mid2 domain-containing protein n=1 Tax=Recurvomyces mirabilis TaxID=574656 RepID=A0AAE1C3H7_9PEZI|nr:hypothetical protein LTR78_003007 [Recurvomyces mirabilis]KAK5157174.1 hypothetical protein LTS14_004692 [Recurvomyces mirabilis]